jgi:hypothetical protein
MQATDDFKTVCKPVNIFQKLHISINIIIIFLVQYLPVTFPCHLHIRKFQ